MKFLLLITLTFFISHSSYADESKFPTCTSTFTDTQSSSTSNHIKVKTKEVKNSLGVAKLGKDGHLRLYTIDHYGSGSHASSREYENYVSELENIVDVRASTTKFIALTNTGTVIMWEPDSEEDPKLIPDLNNVTAIESNAGAFAALRSNGSVTMIGYTDNPYIQHTSTTLEKLKSGVIQLFATDSAFCALKDDGSIVSWGYPQYGGDSSKLSHKLINIKNVYANYGAFVALRDDGTAISWGDKSNGGGYEISNVKNIYADKFVFIALKEDYTFVVMGEKTWAEQLINRVQKGLKALKKKSTD